MATTLETVKLAPSLMGCWGGFVWRVGPSIYLKSLEDRALRLSESDHILGLSWPLSSYPPHFFDISKFIPVNSVNFA